MFDGWTDFFLMIGSAAAVLIGLSFVISLMQDRPRSSVLEGSRLYMGPVVLGVSFVLVLCSAAMVPGIDRRAFAAITAVVALWGLARGVMSFAGLRGLLGREREVHWTDSWFYGLLPILLYLGLEAAALAFCKGWSWAHDALAALLTLILLLAIRNEWDLITWIAPKPDREPG